MNSNLPATLQIQECSFKAYDLFKDWHFVKRQPACPYKTFIIPPNIAIIVYTYSALSSTSRRLATHGLFNRGSRLQIAKNINLNIRTIARIIVNPMFRKHRIATKLIAKTLELVDMPFIECSTNLFGGSKCFVNAGMNRFLAPVPKIWFEIKALYKQIGFEDVSNLNFRHQRIFFDHLSKKDEADFRKKAQLYLNNINCYKKEDSCFQLHRKLFSRIDQVPAYYYWFNPKKSLSLNLTKPDECRKP